MNFPTRRNLNYSVNSGSICGILFISQLVRGLLLVLYYKRSVEMAFARVNQTINMEVTQGWLVRSLHAGGASWLFIWVYAHIVKGILNRS